MVKKKENNYNIHVKCYKSQTKTAYTKSLGMKIAIYVFTYTDDRL